MFSRIAAIAALMFSAAAWGQQPAVPEPERARNIATLKELKGTVLVEQDAPFAAGRLAQSLNEGDRIQAGIGESSAVVEYSDGCELEIDPGTTVTLPQDSPCACAVAAAERDAADGKAPGPAEDAENVAQLEEIKGSVLVNQGVEYVPGTLGQSLDENDRVMAEVDESSRDESTALIKYEDGCDIRVEEGTIVTVPETSPCACGIVVAQNAAPLGGAVIGAAVGGIGPGPIIFGGIVTAIITIVVGSDPPVIVEEDDDETVSP